MNERTITFLKFLGISILTLFVLVCVYLFVGWPGKSSNTEYGVTFSRPYAEGLGLDPNDVLRVALDEVGVRRIRLPAYWKNLEPAPGKWDFTTLDRDLEEIGKRHGKVILAIGEKLPRWPECWEPDWWKSLPRERQREETLRYLETIVTRYRNHSTILAWQVENEPHFHYGDCPTPDYSFIRQETNFVRALDPHHEIYTTDSGELSSWITLGLFVDRLGVSVYRVVRNPILGNANWYYWFVPPYLYIRKATLLHPFGVKKIYVSEFQMEPWSNRSLTETPIDDQLKTMNIQQMRSNFSFAQRMRVEDIDLWGLEWWVWMHAHGHPEFLETVKKFVK